MMKALIILTFFLISYFIYGFYLSQYDVGALRPAIALDKETLFYDYKGIINVHTQKSVGSGIMPQINEDAKTAGADFIMYTDINPLDTPPPADAYDGRLLVLNAAKYSYLDSRLIYYSPGQRSLGYSLGEAQTALSDLISQDPKDRSNSLVILAHPFLKGFQWSGDWPEGLDGIELLNTKSMSYRAWNKSKFSVFWTILVYPFNPQLALFRLFTEPSEEIALLDQLSQRKKIFAYAGSEASARAVPWAGYLIRFPSYLKTFELMSQHLLLESELTGNLQQDRTKILDAMKAGHFYLCLDLLGDPRGFYNYMYSGETRYMMGSEIKWRPGLALKIHLPHKPEVFFEVVVYRNGTRYKTVNTPDVEVPIDEPGVYRVQVRIAQRFPLPDAIKWISWIYGNPYFVR